MLGNSGRHLSLKLSQYASRMRGVAFGQAEEWLPKLEQLESAIDLAFRPVINEFGGFRKVEMQLVDWRLPAPDPVDAPDRPESQVQSGDI